MPQWIALSRTEHRHKRLLPRDGYRFAAAERAVPVLLAELNKVIPHYLLGFIAQGEAFVPVALLGTRDNAYLAPDGRWLGAYVPATLRGYPFTLAGAEDGSRVLAVEAGHLTDDDQGEPLFDGDAPSATVNQTLEFLQQCEQSRETTLKATRVLAKHGLLAEWDLAVPTDADGGTPVKLDGVYRLDEARLNQLDGEALCDLKGAPLTLAYAQMFATGQHKALAERLAFQARHAAQQEAPDDLESFFGESDDELTFDFD
ncbi:SapC family protein [Halomonas piscis]|uniref:SapC family protein n=1 Tax=Halomonas piscis TaxID=3031727 RepID=A0ABY9Z4D4_9GAMM|nr:SapC family protein [Halomonas piscis]WNK21229.1 SapC family protein [Halomonas piscis]